MVRHCKCIRPKWVTTSVMNVPFMLCERCGCGLPEAVVDKTHTKRELREKYRKKERPISSYTQKELFEKIILEAWEEKTKSKRR